jgi:hypothetical protein
MGEFFVLNRASMYAGMFLVGINPWSVLLTLLFHSLHLAYTGFTDLLCRKYLLREWLWLIRGRERMKVAASMSQAIRI